MDEGSDNELDETQETTIKKKLLSSTRNGNDAVINFVGSSTNQELQAYEYYAHLRTSSEILIKEQHQRSVHQNFDNFFKNLHYYFQKQVHPLSLLLESMYVLCLFLVFK